MFAIEVNSHPWASDWCCLRLFSFVFHCHFILINILYLFIAFETCRSHWFVSIYFWLIFFSFAAIANGRFTQNPKRSSFYCAISFLKTWNFPSHYHHFARCNEGCTTRKLSTITMTIQLPPATEICTSRMPSNHIVRCVCSNNRRIIDFHIRYQSNCNLRQYPHYDTMNGTCYALEMSLAALLSCENEFWRSPFSHFIIAPSTSEWTWQIYCMRFAFETKASQCLFCMCARFFCCCKCIRDTSNAIKGKTHTNSADKIGIVTIIALEKKARHT